MSYLDDLFSLDSKVAVTIGAVLTRPHPSLAGLAVCLLGVGVYFFYRGRWQR